MQTSLNCLDAATFRCKIQQLCPELDYESDFVNDYFHKLG